MKGDDAGKASDAVEHGTPTTVSQTIHKRPIKRRRQGAKVSVPREPAEPFDRNAYQRAWMKERSDRDPVFRAMRATMCRAAAILNKAGLRTKSLIGCDALKFRNHIRSQFREGMSWDNYGRNGWHIDHVKPCCSFNLSIPQERAACFNYRNLQPLWAKDNMGKSGRVCPSCMRRAEKEKPAVKEPKPKVGTLIPLWHELLWFGYNYQQVIATKSAVSTLNFAR